MPTLREVPASNILATALRLVGSARESVLATMDMAEELKHPLPQEYFLSIKKKLRAGVTVTRLGFGDRRALTRLKNQIGFTHPRYTLIHIKKGPYQRMLMIDEKKQLFVTHEHGTKKYFYTHKKTEIDRLKRYVSELMLLNTPPI